MSITSFFNCTRDVPKEPTSLTELQNTIKTLNKQVEELKALEEAKKMELCTHSSNHVHVTFRMHSIENYSTNRGLTVKNDYCGTCDKLLKTESVWEPKK